MTALLLAAGLVGLREWLGSVNVALLLVLTVMAVGGVGGRSAGFWTALVAAVSFDFFHTEPYLTLKITEHQDVIATGLLGVVGGFAGLLADRAWIKARAVERDVRSEDRVRHIAAMVERGAPASELISAVEAAAVAELDLESARFDQGDVGSGLPVLRVDGDLATGHGDRRVGAGFDLPAAGVACDVFGCGERVGQLLLFPQTSRVPTRRRQRIVVLNLCSLLGAGLVAGFR